MPSLIAIEGPLTDCEYLVGIENFAIGRESVNNLEIPDLLASRKHCVVEFCGLDASGPRHRIRDLGSANGTLVNGDRVTVKELDPGDRVQIGDCVFVYSAEEPKATQTIAPASIVMQSTVRLQPGDRRLETLIKAATVFGSLQSAE